MVIKYIPNTRAYFSSLGVDESRYDELKKELTDIIDAHIENDDDDEGDDDVWYRSLSIAQTPEEAVLIALHFGEIIGQIKSKHSAEGMLISALEAVINKH